MPAEAKLSWLGLALAAARLAIEEGRTQADPRRYGQAQDVAHAVWFLASRFADYITGEVLHVDGGFKME